jgi:hypothetical protein
MVVSTKPLANKFVPSGFWKVLFLLVLISIQSMYTGTLDISTKCRMPASYRPTSRIYQIDAFMGDLCEDRQATWVIAMALKVFVAAMKVLVYIAAMK